MGVDAVSSSSRATDKGTKIVKPGQELDKNAFLRILTAELSNQDPMNAKDSTQYVAQMAQFASLEQMANMNSALAFSGATNIMGKTVSFNQSDDFGVQYEGVVKGVYKSSQGIKVTVEMIEDGKKVLRDFPYESISDVTETKQTQTQPQTKTQTDNL